jgi:hypothetical protein
MPPRAPATTPPSAAMAISENETVVSTGAR